jgi:hypothetical protein
VSANQYDPTPARKKGGNTRALKGSSGSRSKSGSIGVCDDIYPQVDTWYKDLTDDDDAHWREICTISGWENLYLNGVFPAAPFIFGQADATYLYDACVCNTVFEENCMEDPDALLDTCKKVSALADMTGLFYFPGAGYNQNLGNECPISRHLAEKKGKSFKEISVGYQHDRELGSEECDDFDFESLVKALASLADKDMDQCAFTCLQDYTYLPFQQYYIPAP